MGTDAYFKISEKLRLSKGKPQGLLGKPTAKGEMKRGGGGVNRERKKWNREEGNDKGCRGVEAVRTLNSLGGFLRSFCENFDGESFV